MARRSTGDGSDVIARYIGLFRYTDTPAHKVVDHCERFLAALEPFTHGEGHRADYMRDLAQQIRRTADVYRAQLEGVTPER